MIFNPLLMRKNFDDWMLEATLHAVFENERPMGNVAAHLVNDILQGWLVGFGDELNPVINRALLWLEHAIVEDEDFGTSRNFHRLTLHWAAAVCKWMKTAQLDVNSWKEAREFCGLSMAEPDVYSTSQVSRDALDDFMALCILAGEYDIAKEEFEKYYGVKTVSLKRTLRPREFAYSLCLQQHGDETDLLMLMDAGRKVLKANLEERWLGAGQFIRAATWLIIVHSQDCQKHLPRALIYKAYDDMPNVSRLTPCPNEQ
jgi:hypothetical protein